MRRGAQADRICPNCGVPRLVFGRWKFVWFVKLKLSARNCTERFSPIGKAFRMERWSPAQPGARNWGSVRETSPKAYGGGGRKASVLKYRRRVEFAANGSTPGARFGRTLQIGRAHL